MRIVDPFGSLSIVSLKLRTGCDTLSGSPAGKMSGPATSSPMTRNSQRRSSVSSVRIHDIDQSSPLK
jgi:hypothetical protein